MILTEICRHLVSVHRNFIINKIFVNHVKYNVISVNILIAIVKNVTSFLEIYFFNNKNCKEDADVRKDSILNSKKPVKDANICAFKIVHKGILILGTIVSNVLKIT